MSEVLAIPTNLTDPTEPGLKEKMADSELVLKEQGKP
jgi:hypothetical protein